MTPKSVIVACLLLFNCFTLLGQLVPPAPSKLEAEAQSDSEVLLSWQDNAANEDFYIVERSINNDNNFDVIAVLGQNTTSYLDVFVGPKTTYFYRVKARNSIFFGNFDSNYSNVAQVTTPGPPDPPSALQANTQSKTAIEIDWNDGSPDASNYRLERSANNASNFQFVTNIAPGVEEYLDANLNSNTTYYYRIKANNEYGDSGFSNQDFDITYQFPPSLNAIQDPDPIIENAGSQTVNLSGISAGGFESQVLEIIATSSNPGLIPNPTVSYSSPQSSGSLSYAPAANQTGVAVITVTVRDDGPNNPPENINNSSRTFTVIVNEALPDLKINQVQNPSLICIGESFDVSAKVRNKGFTNSPQSVLSIYFSDGNSTIGDEDQLLGTATVPSLNAGETVTVEANLTVNPGLFEGPFFLLYKVDHANAIEESNENNNAEESAVLLCLPDIAIENLRTEQTTLSKNQNFTIDYELSNLGQIGTGNFNVHYYLTTTEQELSEEMSIGSTEITTIDPGITDSLSVALTIPSETVDGDYFIVAVADVANAVREIDEENNKQHINISIENLPDLNIIDANLSPDLAAFGQTVLFTTVIENIGVEPAQSSITKYYLSADEVFDINDVVFEVETEVPELAVGEQFSAEAWLELPTEFEEGTFFVLAIADGTYLIRENNEINNLVTPSLTLLADIPPVILGSDFPEFRIAGLDNTLITIQAEDDIEIASVNFKYKGIRSSVWDSTSVNLLGSNSYQVSIPGAIFDELGLEYYFEVFDDVGLKAVSDTGFTYIQYMNEGLALEKLNFGEAQTNYSIVSFPLELTNKSIASVFEDDLGVYDKTKWRLFDYDASTGLDEYGEGLNDVQLGQGYWLIIKDETTLDTGEGNTVKANSQNLFEITLKPGWNLIGNPYNFSIKWSDVLSLNGFPSGISGDVKVFESGFQSSDKLNGFQGGFVASNTTINLKLPIKKEEVITVGRTTNNISGWHVNVSISDGNLTHKINGFGMRDDALDGFDQYDETSLPSLGFLADLHLTFDNPKIQNQSIARDVVSNQQNYIWEVALTNYSDERHVYLSWEKVGFESHPDTQLFLFNPTTGVKTNMLENAGIWVDSNTSKNFQILYGNKKFISENLTSHEIIAGGGYPNPFIASTIIPVVLPQSNQSYDLEMSIFNQLGQKVNTLVKGTFGPGQMEIEWDGSDQLGNKVKPGIYFFKLNVAQHNGTQSFTGKLIHR